MDHVHVGSAVSGSGPTQTEYGTTNHQPPSHPGGSANVSGLPLTGLDLGLLLVAAVALIAAGKFLRRVSGAS